MRAPKPREYRGTAMCLAILLPVFFSPPAVHAANVCVASAATLTTALSTAESNGEADTIKIVQGTYNGNFTYSSSEAFDLTIRGGYTGGCIAQILDPTNTVIDGTNSGRVLQLNDISGSGAVTFTVDGLTIKNGNTANSGGGIDTGGANKVVLTNNIVEDNQATGVTSQGGGLRVAATSVDLIGNTVRNNALTGSPISTTLGGGGIRFDGVVTLNVTDNIISNNRATHANYNGGGISVGSSVTTFTFSRNTLTGNQAGRNGGGIQVQQVSAKLTLTNSVFSGNSANDGGGISICCDKIFLINNTITNNSATSKGGGVFVQLFSGLTAGQADLVNNVICCDNTAGAGDDVYAKNAIGFSSSPVILKNNDYDHTACTGSPFTGFSGGGVCFESAGVITATNNKNNIDPLFVTSPANDFHLQAGSPLIDAGDDPSLDLDGDGTADLLVDRNGCKRDVNGSGSEIVDIGAFEHVACLSVAPARHDFGEVEVSAAGLPRAFTITGSGVPPVTLGTLTMRDLSGVLNTSNFRIASDTCSGQNLSLAETCTVNVEFPAPTSRGERAANLTIPSSDPSKNTPSSETGKASDLRVALAGGIFANAGPDLTVNAGNFVTLNGLGTVDPQGDPFTASWMLEMGMKVTLAGLSTRTPSFIVPPTAWPFTFKLTVTDSEGEVTTDEVTVTVVNRVPVATAGPDQAVSRGATVRLDGTGSSDPDGDRLSYVWIQTGGQNVTLSSETSAVVTFTAPSIATTIRFTMFITDRRGGVHSATVTITVS